MHNLKIYIVLAIITFTGYITGCSSNPTIESTAQSTPTLFVLPSGDFELSWDIYDTNHNSLGGIVTIRRQDGQYTKTIVFSDGSCGIYQLPMITDAGDIYLMDNPENSFGDFINISQNGNLNFYDKQGFIFSVPLLPNATGDQIVCTLTKSENEIGNEVFVNMSLPTVNYNGIELIISISTNLPDSMEFMADLENSNGFLAKDIGVSTNGMLTFHFGNIQNGDYSLSVSSSSMSIQPESVVSLLGENGDYMIGDWVAYDQSSDSRFIDYIYQVPIGQIVLTPTPMGPFQYIVQKGDTYFSISENFHVDIFLLKSINNCTMDCEVITNDVIWIPASDDDSSKSTSTSYPTSTKNPINMQSDNFIMSWNIYSSEYNSLGGFLTIRKQGENYTETLAYPNGSCGEFPLELLSINGSNLKLTGHLGISYNDYMMINSNGDLSFMDDLGFIYSVPLLNNIENSLQSCQ